MRMLEFSPTLAEEKEVYMFRGAGDWGIENAKDPPLAPCRPIRA